MLGRLFTMLKDRKVLLLLTSGSTCLVAVGQAYVELDAFRTDIHTAKKSVSSARDIFVRGNRSDHFMNTALNRIDSADKKLSEYPLKYVQPIALWSGGLDANSYLCLKAHIKYHSAVGFIHSGDYAKAAHLLESCLAIRREAETKSAEMARIFIRQGDISSWDNVQTAKENYRNAFQFEAKDVTFMSARAHNNFGILEYSLTHDILAVKEFDRVVDILRVITSLPAHIHIHEGIYSNLKELGEGKLPTSLCPDTIQLLNFVMSHAVDFDYLSDKENEEMKSLEAAERLKIAWRKSIAVRANLIQVYSTSDKFDWRHSLDQLQNLCGKNGQTRGDIHPAYVHLDHMWLQNRGGSRVFTAIGASLTNLLYHGAFPEKMKQRAESLAEQAFQIADSMVGYASATHQGILKFHNARFLICKHKFQDAEQMLDGADSNFGGGLRSSQRDARLAMETQMLRAFLPGTVNDSKKLYQFFRNCKTDIGRDVAHISATIASLSRLDQHGGTTSVLSKLQATSVDHMHTEMQNCLDAVEVTLGMLKTELKINSA